MCLCCLVATLCVCAGISDSDFNKLTVYIFMYMYMRYLLRSTLYLSPEYMQKDAALLKTQAIAQPVRYLHAVREAARTVPCSASLEARIHRLHERERAITIPFPPSAVG